MLSSWRRIALGVLSARLDKNDSPYAALPCLPVSAVGYLHPAPVSRHCVLPLRATVCAVPYRPCLCLWLRVYPYLCLGPCAADHNAVRRRRLQHMYASCLAVQHCTRTPRVAALSCRQIWRLQARSRYVDWGAIAPLPRSGQASSSSWATYRAKEVGSAFVNRTPRR